MSKVEAQDFSLKGKLSIILGNIFSCSSHAFEDLGEFRVGLGFGEVAQSTKKDNSEPTISRIHKSYLTQDLLELYLDRNLASLSTDFANHM